MGVLHVSQNTEGYEVVELLANRVSRNNSLNLVKIDGVECITGGFIQMGIKLEIYKI